MSTVANTDRARLANVIAGLPPWDACERQHLAEARAWVASDAPLYRVRKPAVPPMHLVSYFVVFDEARQRLLLVAHRLSGLWLPAGGHVEPYENPWATVVRECREELGLAAVPVWFAGHRPLFLTVTPTRGSDRHTDVSLWYVIRGTAAEVTWFDEREFETVRWWSLPEVLAEPIGGLDPHLHRFTRKLAAAARLAVG